MLSSTSYRLSNLSPFIWKFVLFSYWVLFGPVGEYVNCCLVSLYKINPRLKGLMSKKQIHEPKSVIPSSVM